MAHMAQQIFCKYVKSIFPDSFKNKTVLDVGSLDINGSNRNLFENCDYTGIDICDGKNVDVNSHLCDWQTDKTFDVVISTEALEHDSRYMQTLAKISKLTKKGGLIIITCATGNRRPHGTASSKPEDSPKTNDWYKNLTTEELLSGLSFSGEYQIKTTDTDLYFWGVK